MNIQVDLKPAAANVLRERSVAMFICLLTQT
jgi:hypothetical protein